MTARRRPLLPRWFWALAGAQLVLWGVLDRAAYEPVARVLMAVAFAFLWIGERRNNESAATAADAAAAEAVRLARACDQLRENLRNCDELRRRLAHVEAASEDLRRRLRRSREGRREAREALAEARLELRRTRGR